MDINTPVFLTFDLATQEIRPNHYGVMIWLCDNSIVWSASPGADQTLCSPLMADDVANVLNATGTIVWREPSAVSAARWASIDHLEQSVGAWQ